MCELYGAGAVAKFTEEERLLDAGQSPHPDFVDPEKTIP
jgi:hypothetical protein